MKFDLGDQTYSFDDEHVSFAEFRFLKRELGLSSGDFITGLPRYDVEALGAAVLLTMRRRAVTDPAAPVFTTADLDKLDMIALINSVAGHAQADAEAAEAADASEAAEAAEAADASEAAEASESEEADVRPGIAVGDDVDPADIRE